MVIGRILRVMRTSTTLSCCDRPMSIIAVTDEQAELTLCSCASCGQHTWSRPGVELGREQALADVRTRAEAVPRSKGGRPRKKSAAEADRAQTDRAQTDRRQAGRAQADRTQADRTQAEQERRVREMQAMLQGFTVHGE